jgi:hypothetical protein
VWSVWSNTAALFIGSTYSMLKVGKLPALTVQHPATLPFERVLASIHEAAKQDAVKGPANVLQGSRLHITLSASVCPPLACPMPSSVKRWEEQQLLARSSAAKQMGITSEDVVCEWDPRISHCVAAMPRWWIASLHTWAQQTRTKVASIQPIWAVATQCALARQSHIKAICVQEIEGVTTLASLQQLENTSHCLYTQSLNPSAPDHLSDDRVEQFGLTSAEVLNLRFVPTAGSALTQGPSMWAQHWRNL